MIKSYVINLDRNPERMAFIGDRLKSLDIDFERFPAINGKEITDQDFKEFADSRPRVSSVGKWTKGKMGCHSSHRKLWKIAAESPAPYTAIFEDDVVISDFLPFLLKNHDWIPEDSDIVRLESTAFMGGLLSKGDIKEIFGRKLQKLLPNKYKNFFPIGTGAYIISKKGAKKIMDAPLHDFLYTDRSLFDHTTSGLAPKLTVYQVTPACCVQDKFYHDSEQNIIFHSEIETSSQKDIYQNQNKIKFFLRKYGSMVGIFQIFALLRRFTYYINGYRKVPYQE